MKLKNKLLQLTAGGVACLLLLTGCGGGTFVTVNGEDVPKKTYDSQMEFYKNLMAYQQQLPTSIEKTLIQDAVIQQDLEKNKVDLTDEDYKEDYDKAIENYGGPENYRQFLESLQISDDQMKESLRLQTHLRKHREMFDKKFPPEEKELKSYYKKHKADMMTIDSSHILVDSKEEAEKVKDRLDKGEKFEDLAKELSKDGSAQNGGELGAQNPDTFDPKFAEALKDLDEGEISDPVKSQFGWHIIRCNKINDAYSELRDQIVDLLNGQAYMSYLQELVSKAKIEKPGEKAEEEDQAGDQAEEDQAEDKQEEDKEDEQGQEDKKEGEKEKETDKEEDKKTDKKEDKEADKGKEEKDEE